MVIKINKNLYIYNFKNMLYIKFLIFYIFKKDLLELLKNKKIKMINISKILKKEISLNAK